MAWNIMINSIMWRGLMANNFMRYGIELFPGHRIELFSEHRIEPFSEHRIEPFPEHRIELFPEHRIESFPEHRIEPLLNLMSGIYFCINRAPAINFR